MRTLLIAGLLLFISGCTQVPLSSLWKLYNLDMMSVDPSQIRVGIRMPQTLRVRRDGAVITMGVAKSKSGAEITERFILEATTKAERAEEFQLSNRSGFDYEVFKIADQDVPRLLAMREKVKIRKAKFPKDTSGFLTVTATGCRLGIVPEGPLPVTTLLKTRNDQEFFILTKDVDLRSIIAKDQWKTEVPPCAF